MKRFLSVCLLVLMTFIISSCSPAEEEIEGEPAPPGDPPEPLTISEIVLRPEGERTPDGILKVPGEIGLAVQSVEAEQVVFYYYPQDEEESASLAGPGRGNDDGWWHLLWEVPEAGEVFTIQARAKRGQEVQTSSLQLTLDAPARMLPVGERGRVSRLDGLPDYFLARGWINENTILGQSGISLFTFNLERSAYRSLNMTAWEVHLSPDRKDLALLKEGGIFLGNLEDSRQRFLWPLERDEQLDVSGVGGGVFAPDGSSMLAWIEHEWDKDFFLLEQPGGEVRPLQTALDNHFLTSFIGWADSSTLIFSTRANLKKDGTREYNYGYRSDLAVYNLQTDRYKLITAADDGEFWEGLATSEKGILFLRRFEEKNADRQTCGFIDLNGKVAWEENLGQVLAGDITADGLKAAFLVREDDDEPAAPAETMNWPGRLLIWDNEKLFLAAEMSIGDSMMRPAWSPSGRQLLFSYSLTEPGTMPGTFRQAYVSLVIEDETE